MDVFCLTLNNPKLDTINYVLQIFDAQNIDI